MSNILTELYDEFAPEYEMTRVPRFRPFVKRLLQLYDTRPGSHVLDAGCGTGLAGTMVAPRVGHGGKVLGVDASAAMLEIALKKAHGFGFTQCEFVVGDMARLDMPNDTFDVVLCSFALWDEPHALFAEFLRVLKPTGVVLMQNWDAEKDAPTAAYEAVAAQFFDDKDAALEPVRAVMQQHRAWWNNVSTPEAYAAVLREVNFTVAHGEWFTAPMHFSAADELVAFLNLSVMRRRQVAQLAEPKRAEFLAAAREALRPFETGKGITIDKRAIQVSARK